MGYWMEDTWWIKLPSFALMNEKLVNRELPRGQLLIGSYWLQLVYG